MSSDLPDTGRNVKQIFEGWNEGEGSGVIGHDCSSRLLPNHYYNAALPLLLHCTAQPCQSRAGVKQWTGVSQLSSSSFVASSSSHPWLLCNLLSGLLWEVPFWQGQAVRSWGTGVVNASQLYFRWAFNKSPFAQLRDSFAVLAIPSTGR